VINVCHDAKPWQAGIANDGLGQWHSLLIDENRYQRVESVEAAANDDRNFTAGQGYQ